MLPSWQAAAAAESPGSPVDQHSGRVVIGDLGVQSVARNVNLPGILTRLATIGIEDQGTVAIYGHLTEVKQI